MALSDEEQQMLDEIESSLLAEEPRFRGLSQPAAEGSFHFSSKTLALLLVGVCLLLVGVVLASSQGSLWYTVISIVGFLVMLYGLASSLGSSETKNTKNSPSSFSFDSPTQASSARGDKMENRFKKRFDR